MSLSDAAIIRIRRLIRSGRLPPGSRLPAEPLLASQLGLSRTVTREAVRALALARVLEVRRGDGVYVTSPQPAAPAPRTIRPAGEPPHPDVVLELTEVLRMVEPAAAAQAATRITAAQLAVVKSHLDAMAACRGDVEALAEHDDAFHRAVTAGAGNRTLTALLEDISGRTLRARVRRGETEADAVDEIVAEHAAIYAALRARDPVLAQATTLLHVHNTERWLREHPTDTPGAGQHTA